MFRFTIRELVLIMALVALTVGWFVERQRSAKVQRDLSKLQHDLGVVENEARQSRVAITTMYQDLERIEQGLSPHGLKLEWSRDMRPSVQPK